MLSRLQWEVVQAQWSDLRGNYALVLVTEAVTGPITNSMLIGSTLAISLMLGLGNMIIISTVHATETVIRRKILGRT